MHVCERVYRDGCALWLHLHLLQLLHGGALQHLTAEAAGRGWENERETHSERKQRRQHNQTSVKRTELRRQAAGMALDGRLVDDYEAEVR